MATNSEIEKLERRWQENPLGLTFAALAEAYRKSGDVPRALELLDTGLAQHPNYVPAHIVRGRCHSDARNVALAEQAFRRVTELDPGNAIALKGLAELAESDGRVSEAIGRLEAMLEVDRNNEEARGQLERLRELPPADSPATAAPEDSEVVIVGLEELTPAPAGEIQRADDSVILAPTDEGFPEIVLEAEELERSLPVVEAALGSDMIAQPDPSVATGQLSTDAGDEPPSAAESEPPPSFAGDLSPEPAPESEQPEPVPPETEWVFEAAAVAAGEPEPAADEASPGEPVGEAEAALEPEAETEEPLLPEVVAHADIPEPWEPVEEREPEPELVVLVEPNADPVPAAEVAMETDAGPAPVEPELMVTETMAEIFLRQGHRELALAVYSQLAQREPGNQRVRESFARLQAELAPPPEPPPPPVEEPPRYDAVSRGGVSVAQLFASLLTAGRPSLAPPIHPPTFELPRKPSGEPTRPAAQSLSLGAVFGEGAPPAGPAGGLPGTPPNEPSFEQFFTPSGDAASGAELPRAPENDSPAMSAMAPEDLEQFNAWLRGLKR